MIVNHRHKFIFLKTRKTAGRSIEIALSQFCDSNDIITPITDEDERTRQEMGFRGPQKAIPHKGVEEKCAYVALKACAKFVLALRFAALRPSRQENNHG